MGRVDAFAIGGLDLWFNSHDHGPPHFHARRPGDAHNRRGRLCAVTPGLRPGLVLAWWVFVGFPGIAPGVRSTGAGSGIRVLQSFSVICGLKWGREPPRIHMQKLLHQVATKRAELLEESERKVCQ